MAKQKSPTGEQSYRIEDQDRDLMVEAGLRFYLNEKKAREAGGKKWTPDMFFRSAKVKQLPVEVQAELKKRIKDSKAEKIEYTRVPAGPVPENGDSVWQTLEIENTGVASATEEETSEEDGADEEPLPEQPEQDVSAWRTPELDRAPIPRESLATRSVEKQLRELGIDPKKSPKENADQAYEKWRALRETLAVRIERLRSHKTPDLVEAEGLLDGELEELLGYGPGEGFTEEHDLRREEGQAILATEQAPEYLRAINELYVQAVISGAGEGVEAQWASYLEDLTREFYELEKQKREELSKLKELIEQRVGKALERHIAGREERSRQAAETEPPEWAPNEKELERHILEQLYQGGVIWAYEPRGEAADDVEEDRGAAIGEGERPKHPEQVKGWLDQLERDTKQAIEELHKIYEPVEKADLEQLYKLEKIREVDRFWYKYSWKKYSGFDPKYLTVLQEQISQLTPSRTISRETVEYWQEYAKTIVDKAVKLAQLVEDEYFRVKNALKDRREELNQEELSSRREEELSRKRKEEKREWNKKNPLPWTADGIKRVQENLDRWLAQKNIRDWPPDRIAGELFRFAVGDSAKGILKQLISPNEGERFDPEYLEEELDLEIEHWKKVVEHYQGGLKNPLETKAIEQAAYALASEREKQGHGKFSWERIGVRPKDWAWIRGVEQSEIPEQVAVADILEYAGLDVDSPVARKLFEFLNFLEAARRLQNDQERKAQRAPRKETEAAMEREEESIPPGEWHKRAEFFALGHILSAKDGPVKDLQAEAHAFLKDNSKKRLRRLRDLFLRVIEEKGVSVPGARREQSLETGQNQAMWWDRVAIQRPGEQKTQYVHGLVRGIWGPGKGPLTMDVYDISTRALIKSGEEIPEQWVRELHYAVPSSLDGRAAIELLRLAGVKVYDRVFPEIPGSKKNLFHVLAGEVDPASAFAVNTGGVHGVGFTGAERELTRAHKTGAGPEKGSAEELFQRFVALRKEKKPLPDDFFAQISPDQLKMFLDHHSPRSSQETAGVKYLYECLRALGSFDHLKPKEREALERAIQFVVYDDNKSHPHYLGQFWLDKWETVGHRTPLGLARFMTLERLMAVYQKYGDSIDTDIREFSDQELQELGLAEISQKQKELTERAGKEFDELVREGYVLEDTKYGPVLVLPLQMEANGKLFKKYLTGGVDMVAARFGDGGIMHYNHLAGELFFSTTGVPVDRIPDRAPKELGDMKVLRGTMIIGKGVRAGLRDVAHWLLRDGKAPKGEADLFPGDALLRYGDPEHPQGERAQRSRYAPERIFVEHGARRLYEQLPHLWGGPVPLEVDAGGRMKVQHWWQPQHTDTRRDHVHVVLKPEHVGKVDPRRAIDKRKRYFIRPTHMEEDPIAGWRMVIAELEGECADSAGARDLEEAMQQAAAQRFGIKGKVYSSAWVNQWRAAWENYQAIMAQKKDIVGE